MPSSWFFALAASCWTSSWASCDTPEGGLIKRIWKEEPQARSGAWPLVVWFGFRLENLHERLTGTKSCGLRQRPLGASGRCWQNALKASKCNNIKDDFIHLLHVFMFAKVWFIGASAAKGVCVKSELAWNCWIYCGAFFILSIDLWAVTWLVKCSVCKTKHQLIFRFCSGSGANWSWANLNSPHPKHSRSRSAESRQIANLTLLARVLHGHAALCRRCKRLECGWCFRLTVHAARATLLQLLFLEGFGFVWVCMHLLLCSSQNGWAETTAGTERLLDT